MAAAAEQQINLFCCNSQADRDVCQASPSQAEVWQYGQYGTEFDLMLACLSGALLTWFHYCAKLIHAASSWSGVMSAFVCKMFSRQIPKAANKQNHRWKVWLLKEEWVKRWLLELRAPEKRLNKKPNQFKSRFSQYWEKITNSNLQKMPIILQILREDLASSGSRKVHCLQDHLLFKVLYIEHSRPYTRLKIIFMHELWNKSCCRVVSSPSILSLSPGRNPYNTAD